MLPWLGLIVSRYSKFRAACQGGLVGKAGLQRDLGDAQLPTAQRQLGAPDAPLPHTAVRRLSGGRAERFGKGMRGQIAMPWASWAGNSASDRDTDAVGNGTMHMLQAA